MKYTLRHWLVLVFINFVNVCTGSIFTLQGPIFPFEIQKRNGKVFEYAIVFGIYEFAVLVSSPLMGPLVRKLGPTKTLFVGLLLQAVTTTLFGFLNLIPTLYLFMGISILLRILEGVGFAASWVGSYSVIPEVYPDDVAVIVGSMEMAQGFGLTIGPMIGGLLFTIGGFMATFLLPGIILFLMTFLTPFMFTKFPMGGANYEGDIRIVLRKPRILINFVILAAITFVLSSINATLTPFLHSTFNMSPLTIGFMLGLHGALSAVLSPIWGYIIGKIDTSVPVLLGALVIDILGVAILGPLPILGIPVSLLSTLIGMSLFAIGSGAAVLSSFNNSISESKLYSFSNDNSIMALLSACYIFSYSFGTTLGAPISGYMYDKIGFSQASYCFVCVLTIFGLLPTVYICITNLRRWICLTNERQRLLRSSYSNGIKHSFSIEREVNTSTKI